MLGLSPSTTWALLSGQYRRGGITGSVIIRVLDSPKLPHEVRHVVEDYVRRKLAGEYGPSTLAIARFRDHLERHHSRLIAPGSGKKAVLV